MVSDEPSVLTILDNIYASPVTTSPVPPLLSRERPTALIVSQSLPTVDDVLPSDEDFSNTDYFLRAEADTKDPVPIVESTLPLDIDSDDEDGDTIGVNKDNPLHTSIVTHINTLFDNGDDYLAVELSSIINHQYTNEILELMVEYSKGETAWHPLGLVKDKNQ